MRILRPPDGISMLACTIPTGRKDLSTNVRKRGGEGTRKNSPRAQPDDIVNIPKPEGVNKKIRAKCVKERSKIASCSSEQRVGQSSAGNRLERRQKKNRSEATKTPFILLWKQRCLTVGKNRKEGGSREGGSQECAKVHKQLLRKPKMLERVNK